MHDDHGAGAAPGYVRWMGVLGIAAAVAGPAMAQSEQVNTLRAQVQAHRAQMAARAGLPPSSSGSGIGTDIVGGKPAPDGRWPFMVALLSSSIPSNYDAQFCGASLISGRDVLTAAHCVVGSSAKSIQVLVGTQDLNAGGRRIDVEHVTTHPKYNPRTSSNDVAVLRLKTEVTDITPTGYIETVDEETRVAPAGRKTAAMGWGNTEDVPAFPSALKQVKLPMVDRTVCNGADAYNGQITQSMICAGDYELGGIDTCQGDSGGPLIAKGPDGKFNRQVGITSWGLGCADPKKPGVYSRLATLGSWVSQQVAKP